MHVKIFMDSQGIISLFDVTKKRFTTARCKTERHTSTGKMGQNAHVFRDE